MKPCNVPHPDIFVIAHGYNRAVHCIRDLNHLAERRSEVVARVTWIEPGPARRAPVVVASTAGVG